MKVRFKNDGRVVSITAFKQEFKDTSFPEQLTETIINEFGCDIVLDGPHAMPTTRYEYSFEDGVEQIGDQWYTKYSIGPKFNSEDERIEYINQCNEDFKNKNVSMAKQLLLETDWADLMSVRNQNNTPHLSNIDEFDAYRLFLRSIVVNPQAEVTWPQKPSAKWE